MTLLSVLLAQATSPSWWEPGTPNFLDVGDMSAVFAFALAILGALSAVIKRAIKTLRAMIREEISVATAPIHPSSNGGLSLPDVARRTRHLEEKMNMIYEMQQKNNKLYTMVVDKIMEIETELDHMDEEHG
jgi:phosphoglycerate-specific signal transduction histidine kinase